MQRGSKVAPTLIDRPCALTPPLDMSVKLEKAKDAYDKAKKAEKAYIDAKSFKPTESMYEDAARAMRK